MKNNYLSNIELYYTPPDLVINNELTLLQEEVKHAVKVMRNSVGDDLYVTDGAGNVYLSEILLVKKNSLRAKIIKAYKFNNESEDLVFCVPKLKNLERLKFAIEKCIELGITQFKIFESLNTISKTSNLMRYQRIAITAMKQSLRSFLPQIEFDTFEGIRKCDGSKILFDQKANLEFKSETKFSKPAFFIFGPEGGIDKSELDNIDFAQFFKLGNHRLRTETAIVKCASLLNLS